MDYNYVRMRNALKRGDLPEAEEYKILYETGRIKKKTFSVLDYAIAILLFVTVLLGIYILHSEAQRDAENVTTDISVTSGVQE